ncbi:MAG: SIMPL domain-containing protein [Clostridia bacterium]|nr:SIMPL domain-containing protein [Clostridia bacterium]
MYKNRIVALIVALLMLLAGTAALAENTITVQGIGSVKVDSDRAGISLGVREAAAEVMTAQSMVNERISAIVEVLKGMGLIEDDISTNGIGIYPNYNYDDGETIIGYTAYNNIYLTVKDVNNTGAYIDAAFAAGANSLDYVEFSATETEEADAKALALAVESAREKARIIADAAGVKLGEIVEMHDNADMSFGGNGIYVKNAEEADAGSGTDVMASKQTVSAAVSVTFAFE